MTNNFKNTTKKLAVVPLPALNQLASCQEGLQKMPTAQVLQQELAGAKSVEDFFGREGIFAKLFASTCWKPN